MTDADTTDRDAEPQQLEQDIADDAEVAPDADGLEERLVAEGEIAGDYLEELLDLLDSTGISTWTSKATGRSWHRRRRGLEQVGRPQRRSSRRAAGVDQAGCSSEDGVRSRLMLGRRQLAPAASGRAGRSGR